MLINPVLVELGTRWEITRNWLRLRDLCNDVACIGKAYDEATMRANVSDLGEHAARGRLARRADTAQARAHAA